MCEATVPGTICPNPATRQYVSFTGARTWLCDEHFVQFKDIESHWTWFQKWRYRRYLKSRRHERDLKEAVAIAAQHFDEWFPAEEASPSLEDESGDELGFDEEFEAELRAVEAKARSEKQRILALLADTGVTEEQLDELGWEYLDAGHSDMTPDGPYVAWIRERLARGPIMDDGGAAEGRVRARWEFAALSEEEQRRQLDRAFADMRAAVKDERAEDTRAALATCWLMVEARRLTWERKVAAEYEATARSEGHAASAVSDFADALGHHLDEITSALEHDEELLPDDVIYRTFTLTENLASLVARHLRQRGTPDVLDLLEILPGALLSLSEQTPSGGSVPNLDLERTDD